MSCMQLVFLYVLQVSMLTCQYHHLISTPISYIQAIYKESTVK